MQTRKSDLVINRSDIEDLNQGINLLEELLQENILLGANNTILKQIREEKEEINKRQGEGGKYFKA